MQRVLCCGQLNVVESPPACAWRGAARGRRAAAMPPSPSKAADEAAAAMAARGGGEAPPAGEAGSGELDAAAVLARAKALQAAARPAEDGANVLVRGGVCQQQRAVAGGNEEKHSLTYNGHSCLRPGARVPGFWVPPGADGIGSAGRKL